METRVALVGYGLAGAAFHAPLIAATPGLRLASVVTSREDRVRSRYPEARVLPAVEELWRRPDEQDLVVVAAPNRVHASIGRAALDAGLHVVIDKPMAVTVEEARLLDQVARERALMLAPFHNRRWDGDMLTLRRLVAEGALGEVLRFESRFERWRPEVVSDRWRELAAPEEAGGVLYDLGTHLIDQALVLFGDADLVHAEIDRRRPGAEVDDDVFLALVHRSGVRSHLWMSQTAAHAGPRMRVLGSEAAYVKWGLDVQEDALRAGGRPGDPGWGSEPPEAWGELGAGGEFRPVETEPGDYGAFYRGVASTLREGAPPPVAPADAIAVLELIEQAFRNARKRGMTQGGR